jgi:hypothetical protein
MTVRTAVDDATPAPSQCWCCGKIEDPTRLVHLGNHPEVTLCLGCAHFVSKRASEIEDQNKTGAAVRGRDLLRRARAGVIQHGWHQHPILGRPLRWIGKHTP